MLPRLNQILALYFIPFFRFWIGVPCGQEKTSSGDIFVCKMYLVDTCWKRPFLQAGNLIHFTPPYLQFPPPAVFHDKYQWEIWKNTAGKSVTPSTIHCCSILTWYTASPCHYAQLSQLDLVCMVYTIVSASMKGDSEYVRVLCDRIGRPTSRTVRPPTFHSWKNCCDSEYNCIEQHLSLILYFVF